MYIVMCLREPKTKMLKSVGQLFHLLKVVQDVLIPVNQTLVICLLSVKVLLGVPSLSQSGVVEELPSFKAIVTSSHACHVLESMLYFIDVFLG